MQRLRTTMNAEDKSDVSASGSRGSEGMPIGDIGFRGESEIESDIMVGILGSQVFFHGIFGGGAEEGDGDEEFRAFERKIEETLEIREEEGFEFYCGNHSEGSNSANKSDEIVTSVRTVVQSVPLPGQISQSIVSDSVAERSKYGDVTGYCRRYLKRKHEEKDVQPKECTNHRKKHNDVVACSMQSSLYRQFEDFLISSTKYSPADNMLSQLQMLAQNPMGDHCFSSSFIRFFSDFRNKNMNELTNEDDKREITHCPTMECALHDAVEDIKDSYWTDMAIQTESSGISPAVNTVRDLHVLDSSSSNWEVNDPSKLFSRKSFESGNVPLAATTGNKNSLAELILTFDDAQAIPSECKLNKIFKRFGPLRESETVVYQDFSRARVVYKRSSDAEVAYNSANIFNIIGTEVSYELGFAPLLSCKAKSAVNMDNITNDHQIPESELSNEFEFGPDYTSTQQMEFQYLEEKYVAYKTLEMEDCEEFDDVDIMT